ncbi:hypothetical protein T484DRAFT_1834754 [Baffinella frigidus]|nr:hypothetical protein T484DRAFT_1834754 [Cryptophyta sp. CCMP2293]
MAKFTLVALALPALASAFMPGAPPSMGLRAAEPRFAAASSARPRARSALSMVVQDITSEGDFDAIIASTAADKLAAIDFSTTWP